MDLRRLRPQLPVAGLLLAGLLAAAGLLLEATPAAASGGLAAAPADGWSWPLHPRPVVAAPFDEPAGPYAPGHRGVDLLAPPGSPVLAAADGTVAFAGRVAGRGVVSVDHPGGLRTTYEPVAARVTRGDGVARASVLGVLEPAPSHCGALACLHWGVRRGETYLDPLTLMGAVRVRLLPVWGAELPGSSMPGSSLPGSSLRRRSAPWIRGPTGASDLAPAGGSPAVGAGSMAVGAGGLVLAGAAVHLRRRGPPG